MQGRSHRGSISLVTTNCEKSAEPIVVGEVSVMEMERRGEQSISLSMSCIAEKTTSAVINRVKGWSNQARRKGKNAWTQVI